MNTSNKREIKHKLKVLTCAPTSYHSLVESFDCFGLIERYDFSLLLTKLSISQSSVYSTLEPIKQALTWEVVMVSHLSDVPLAL